MLFTEKCLGLSIRQASGTVTRLFGTAGSSLVANDLFCEGQSGVHGVAVDPQFAANRYVYVYMASNLSTNPLATRLPELVLIEMLRQHLATTPAAEHGWIAALHDPVLAPALSLLHR